MTLTYVLLLLSRVYPWPQVCPTHAVTADDRPLSVLFQSKSSLNDTGYVWMLSCIPRVGGHSEDGLSLFFPDWSQLSLLIHYTEMGEVILERLSTQLLDRE